eukprot:PhF_6_TR21082/c0_g2_i2/m.30395
MFNNYAVRQGFTTTVFPSTTPVESISSSLLQLSPGLLLFDEESHQILSSSPIVAGSQCVVRPNEGSHNDVQYVCSRVLTGPSPTPQPCYRYTVGNFRVCGVCAVTCHAMLNVALLPDDNTTSGSVGFVCECSNVIENGESRCLWHNTVVSSSTPPSDHQVRKQLHRALRRFQRYLQTPAASAVHPLSPSEKQFESNVRRQFKHVHTYYRIGDTNAAVIAARAVIPMEMVLTKA